MTWVESYGVVFSQAQEEDCACLAMLARSSHSSEDSTLRLYLQDSSRCCDDILTSTVSFRAGAKRVEQSEGCQLTDRVVVVHNNGALDIMLSRWMLYMNYGWKMKGG